MRILIPDAQFVDDADIERVLAGADAEVEVHRAVAPEHIPEESWRRCDAIVMWHVMRITPAVVDLLDNCRVVVRSGIGVERIDLEACARRGIPVCNCPDYGITDVADHAIALYLALARGLSVFHDALRDDPVGLWDWSAPPLIGRVRGRRFGIVGLGRIGTATARRARAFDMELAFYDPYVPVGQEQSVAAHRMESLEELLAGCDVISLHAPHTAETHHMLNADSLAAMRPGSILVNTARGGLVDLDALHGALQSGRPAGAALDVFAEEPPEPQHPLIAAYRENAPWLRGRFLMTPHAAFYSDASMADLRRKPTETAMLYLTDGRLRNCVNGARLLRHGHDLPGAVLSPPQ